MLHSGSGDKCGGLWAAKVLLLIRKVIKESSESQEYACLQFTQM